jgi:hypothetical protein
VAAVGLDKKGFYMTCECAALKNVRNNTASPDEEFADMKAPAAHMER